MTRKFLIPLLTVTFLAMPAFAPATKVGLSGSAAAETIRPSKSNSSDRVGSGGGQTTQPGGTKTDKTTTINASHSNSYRMGGGGGRTK
jgi:hypothetical protein